MSNVTVNTDASFHPKHKVGAFAFWIVSDKGRISQSGAFREPVRNSHEAEVQCILNAMFMLNKAEWGIKKVIINTDSVNAIAIFKNHKHQIKRYGLAWGNKYRKDFTELSRGFSIEFRHVRAHQEITTKKQWVNDWCDKAAKKAMWVKLNSTNK